MSSTTDRASSRPVPPAAADRGLDDVLESLYRGSGRRRTALPRYEPALRPPEDADGYAWLYRPEPQHQAAETALPTADTVVRPRRREPAHSAADPVAEPRPPKAVPPAPRRRGVAVLVAGSGVPLCVALDVSLLAHLL